MWWCSFGVLATASLHVRFLGSLARIRRRRASRRSIWANCLIYSFLSVRLYQAFGLRCSSSVCKTRVSAGGLRWMFTNIGTPYRLRWEWVRSAKSTYCFAIVAQRMVLVNLKIEWLRERHIGLRAPLIWCRYTGWTRGPISCCFLLLASLASLSLAPEFPGSISRAYFTAKWAKFFANLNGGIVEKYECLISMQAELR